MVKKSKEYMRINRINNQKGFTTFSLHERGFTLIELLVVIAIIAALAVVVFVALNPAQRLKDARDARRTSDADTILTAIHADIVDSKGIYPTGMAVAGTEYQLGTGSGAACIISTGGCGVLTGSCADLMTGANNLQKYLKSMPVDPSGGVAATTKYSVAFDTNGIVTVRACGTEGATNISVSR